MDRIIDLLDNYRTSYSDQMNMLNSRNNGEWTGYSASDYVSYSDMFSLGLISMGIQPGVRVGTILLNCPEWNFIDMGLLQAGAVQVPIYPTLSAENYKYILNDSGVEFLIVSNEEIYNRILPVLPGLKLLKEVFSIATVAGIRSWNEILKLGHDHRGNKILEEIKKTITPDSLATIIYTSGTTGRPKGVMLSHRNFVSNFKALAVIPPLAAGDRIVSFLPLCHVYERTANYAYQFLGVRIFYLRRMEDLAQSITEVRPHAFSAVPRILEKIYNGLVTKGRNLPFPLKGPFFWAIRQGHKFELDHSRGWFYDARLWFADLIVFRRWRRRMGDEIKFIVCGSASLHPRITRIFWAARMPVLEGYGLTETSPVISFSRWERGGVKFSTVGPLIDGVAVKIAADGEILVKSPGVMLGYYNRPERTAQVMDPEGWFHTGDIGEMEEGKFLKITNRKKEMFKTSGGKYIAPQVIEQMILASPFIEQIMVAGENRPFPVALIIPNFDYLNGWCHIKGIPFASNSEVVKNQTVIARFAREIAWYNLDLGQTEKIKKFIVLDREWTVAEGELSPTLKLRRNYILQKYQKVIEEMYNLKI